MKTGLKILFSLLAGALLCSCQEKIEPEVELEEEISVDVSEIEATASLASYDVNVTSNTSWTVKVSGESGSEVSWVTSGRPTGSGNLMISFRVSENKYSVSRTAKILFETPAGKSAEVLLVQMANETVEEKKPEDDVICIGSYNLRMSHLDLEEDYIWDVRKDRLETSIMNAKFDIFGIQEVDSKTQVWLNVHLASKYAFCYFSPYSQDGKGTRAQGIGYRKDLFTLSDWHFFWASDTPDVMVTNDGAHNRGGCCCVLTHKDTGEKYFVMNNHGCLDDAANDACAHVYVDMEKKYNTEGLPSFFVGDMNAKQSNVEGNVYVTYVSHWEDSYLKAQKRTGATGTYNGYKAPNGSSRIDFVFYRGSGIEPQLYHCDNTLYQGLYASDHFPLWVEFKIKK